jgi:hypothetical protein
MARFSQNGRRRQNGNTGGQDGNLSALLIKREPDRTEGDGDGSSDNAHVSLKCIVCVRLT